jgi:uncharacterized protein (DUF433 family)
MTGAEADLRRAIRYTIAMSTTNKLEYPLKLKEQAKVVLDSLTAAPPPLRLDEDSVLRVGPTRVRLDTVIFAFNSGCTPEGILDKYPALTLTDIYAVIVYYLWHRELIDAYLEEREKFAEEMKREIEARSPKEGLKERLLARRAARE